MTFDEIIQSRYSVRKLLPKPTEPKLLEEALAVHPFAPTAKNNQPKRSMSSKERPPLKLSIPWPIAVTGPGPSSSSFTMNPRFGGTPLDPHIDSGIEDTAISATYVMLKAPELGLASCWCNYFDNRKLSEALGLKEGEKPVVLMPIGYKDPAATPSPMHGQSKEAGQLVAHI